MLIGNLGADPEIRYTPSGSAVANFNIATTDYFVDKEGQKQERTEWHRIVVWGKQAEHCGEYLGKGRSVYIEGKLQTRSWEDKDGQKRYTTEVVAQLVQFLGSKSDSPARGTTTHNEFMPPPQERAYQAPTTHKPAPAAGPGTQAAAAPTHTTANKNFDYGPPPLSDDDIPF